VRVGTRQMAGQRLRKGGAGANAGGKRQSKHDLNESDRLTKFQYHSKRLQRVLVPPFCHRMTGWMGQDGGKEVDGGEMSRMTRVWVGRGITWAAGCVP
jgi:hypothetical protein